MVTVVVLIVDEKFEMVILVLGNIISRLLFEVVTETLDSHKRMDHGQEGRQTPAGVG